MRAVSLFGLALSVFTYVSATAQPLTLKCIEQSPKRGEPLDFYIAIDVDRRQVLDIGYGSGVQTTEFSETEISAKHDPGIGMIFQFDVNRLSGEFAYRWIAIGKDGRIRARDSKMFFGLCEMSQRKF